MLSKLILAFALALLGFVATSSPAQAKLTKIGKIQNPLINESSGLVKSRNYDSVYWTHNDSGDEARIFAIDTNGADVGPSKGIAIEGAVNIDWEDIAVDNSGNLYIGAFGNNENDRQDLAVYVINEPNPRIDSSAPLVETRFFYFPDQDAFPPKKRNFDCEALFWANGKLFFLTKHRSDRNTKLYRMDTYAANESSPLTLVQSFPIRGQVTAADATPDGSRIAILTYHDIHVFEKPEHTDNYLSGKKSSAFIVANQCESVSWEDDNAIIIGNEQQDLFRVSVSTLK